MSPASSVESAVKTARDEVDEDATVKEVLRHVRNNVGSLTDKKQEIVWCLLTIYELLHHATTARKYEES